MNCLRVFKYKLLPEGSYEVIRNCSGCGKKSHYYNTNHFRVNANGNKVDVWLIYQCRKCKRTLNIPIFERQNKADIAKSEYRKFMENDRRLAMEYGMNKEFFIKNRVEINQTNIRYGIISVGNTEKIDKTGMMLYKGTEIIIENPYGLKLRTDKITAEVLNITRSKEKKLEKSGGIIVEPCHHGIRIYIF